MKQKRISHVIKFNIDFKNYIHPLTFHISEVILSFNLQYINLVFPTNF